MKKEGVNGFLPGDSCSLLEAQTERSHSHGVNRGQEVEDKHVTRGDVSQANMQTSAAGGIYLRAYKILQDGKSFSVEKAAPSKALPRRPQGESTQVACFSGQNFDRGRIVFLHTGVWNKHI